MRLRIARMNGRVVLGVALAALVVLGGIFLRLQGAGEEDAAGMAAAEAEETVRATAAEAAFPTEVAVPVAGARTVRDTFVIWVEAQGRAAALRSAPLHAEVAGPVVAAPLREGERVAAGQLLIRIDPAPYELEVRSAEAELERARAEFRSLTLFDDDIGDEAVREERERQARIRSGLPASEAAVERARYELSKTEIRAPFAGRLANLAVGEGSRLRSGDSVAVVVDLSRVDVAAEVLYTEVPHLEVGREARVTFPALPGELFSGRVVTINPLVGRETRTARVTVRLENPEARVLPGMPGTVRIAGRLLADRLFVPREAIVERDRRPVVFLFEPEEEGAPTGRAKWTYVTLGAESGRFVELAPSEETGEPPREGAVVLVDGHATLVHDARVRVENLPELEGP